jgi:paraquat-inducible protein A|tara:strand:- start:749 stop:1330 length:582 start_codon:yes stop_codon:yes gene_type:complete
VKEGSALFWFIIYQSSCIFSFVSSRSLARRARRHRDVPVLLLGAALFLGIGFTQPVMEVQKLVVWKTEYSLFGGVLSLYEDGEYFLSIVVGLFVLVLPLLRLIFLALLWYLPLQAKSRRAAFHWLHYFARWAMLDVFLVAIALIMTQTNPVATVRPRLGMYLYAVGVVLSMVLALRVDLLQGRKKPARRTKNS